MPTTRAAPNRPHLRQEDIDRSPVYLLASLFPARRSGDYPLYLLYRDRLKKLGIHVKFTGEGEAEAEASVPTTPIPPAATPTSQTAQRTRKAVCRDR
jgi:hypothetical protein